MSVRENCVRGELRAGTLRVAGSSQPAAEKLSRIYRAPLSLSIFQGGTDYLVTDGPFAYTY